MMIKINRKEILYLNTFNNFNNLLEGRIFPENKTSGLINGLLNLRAEIPEAMKQKKIVIVDDFTGIRSIVRETLVKKGFLVLEASSGEEALKFFDGTQIDLLITDFDMPEMNGAELIARIRDLTRYIYTPVIVLSGVRKERVEGELEGLNIACFMQKPFEITHFYSVVERLTGRMRKETE